MKRSSLFIPVRLICSAEELSKRIINPERAAMLKMTCPIAGKKLVEEVVIFKPNHPNCLELDVSNLSAREAAEQIIFYAKNLL